MYGLAAHEEQDSNSGRWMDIAKGITNTCHESYDRTDTKLGPEAFRYVLNNFIQNKLGNQESYAEAAAARIITIIFQQTATFTIVALLRGKFENEVSQTRQAWKTFQP